MTTTESNLAALGYQKMPRSEFPPIVQGQEIYSRYKSLWAHPLGNFMPALEIDQGETDLSMEELVKRIAKAARDNGATDEAKRRAIMLAQCLDDKPTTGV